MRFSASSALRGARQSNGWSQRELGVRASVAQPGIARIESGAVVPSVDTLEHLLAVCGYGLECVGRPGAGIDRSTIRELLKMTAKERLDMAVEEARNLDSLLASARS